MVSRGDRLLPLLRHLGDNDDGTALNLIGEADETSLVEQCCEMVAHARTDGAPIALIVYPGVQALRYAGALPLPATEE